MIEMDRNGKLVESKKKKKRIVEGKRNGGYSRGEVKREVVECNRHKWKGGEENEAR